MIIRRLVLGLVLLLFASMTVGVILGLDSAARSSVVERLTGSPASAPAESMPAESMPAESMPAESPTSRATARAAEPTKTATPKPTVRHKATSKPSSTATTSASPSAKSTSKSGAKRKNAAKRKSAATSIYLTGPLKKGAGGTVHLTFDDGPGPATQKVLDTLAGTGSTATFFQLGINVPSHPKAAAAIKAEGSNIGNHTYNHPDLTRLGASQLRWQLAHGPRAKCFRPPYGATNSTVRQAIRNAGMRQVLWDVDTVDWSQPGVATLAKVGRLRSIKDGTVILMHDGGGDRAETLAALPTIIADLQARGFKIRALPYC